MLIVAIVYTSYTYYYKYNKLIANCTLNKNTQLKWYILLCDLMDFNGVNFVNKNIILPKLIFTFYLKFCANNNYL